MWEKVLERGCCLYRSRVVRPWNCRNVHKEGLEFSPIDPSFKLALPGGSSCVYVCAFTLMLRLFSSFVNDN